MKSDELERTANYHRNECVQNNLGTKQMFRSSVLHVLFEIAYQLAKMNERRENERQHS